MIDEKKIEEAADEYCAHLFSETIPRPHRQSWSGDTIIFKAGIEWFKENLWHESYENQNNILLLLSKVKLMKSIIHVFIVMENLYVMDLIFHMKKLVVGFILMTGKMTCRSSLGCFGCKYLEHYYYSTGNMDCKLKGHIVLGFGGIL